jgi:hypothetical protein
MRKLLIVAVLVGALGIFGTASVAFGDPDLTLQATPHRHYINGVQVGPRWCDHLDSAAVKAAFTQFHANVHTHMGVTGEIGSPAAPGLHDGSGPGIISAGC